ncbi:MAG: peptidylprolyl isomerase [Eubacterium sp.]|nr:peptidylprolyl isomerase [Eubacterium sp.]
MVIVCFLAASTCLTACGSESEETTETTQANEEPKDHEKTVPVENSSMKEDSTVIAVGQTAVSYAEYKSYYYFMESQYNALLGDQVWKQSAGGNKTIGQEAIEDVLRMIIQVKVIVKEAAKQGITLEPDEKEDADYNAQKLYDSLGEDVTKEAMMSVPLLMEIFEENKLAEKTYRVVTGQAETGVSGTGLSAYRVQLLFKKAKDDDREQVRSEVENLQKKIAGSDKNFYTYAKKESDLPEVEYVIGSLDERKNLWMSVTSLRNNVISPVIEESDGFYIAMVLEKPNDEMNTEYQNQVVSEKQIEAFQKSYEEWSKNYDVEVSDALLSD